jgi:hypothetical protein
LPRINMNCFGIPVPIRSPEPAAAMIANFFINLYKNGY